MSSRKNRLARLRSVSSEFGRSRSVTPSSNSHERRAPKQSAARRALLMGLVPRQERNVAVGMPSSPNQSSKPSLGGDRTLGGRGHLTSEIVSGSRSPGGHVRERVASPIFASIEERVEAMDLTDEEADDAPSQVARWFPEMQSVATTTVAVAEESVPSCSGMAVTRLKDSRARANSGSEYDSDFDDEFDIENIAADRPSEIPDDDDLDEPVRNILTSVAKAMDDAVDGLLGESNNFIWEEDFDTFRGTPEDFTGPTPGPLKDYDTPYDAFCEIWTEDIIEHIVKETNRYAQQTIDEKKAKGDLKNRSRVHNWINTNANEIMVLLAIFMYMGIDQRSVQEEYWKNCDFLSLALFKNLMTYSQYLLLSKFLHFVDNSDVSQSYLQYGETRLPKELAKISPILKHLNEKFSSIYNCRREISIHETFTLFKGRLSWIQTIRSKAERFGIKSYELCESRTGYLYKFQIYTGKTESNNGVAPWTELGGKSNQVVLELLKGLENRGHCVTMDNFYNSPSLARYLKSQGFDCLGTLRVNRNNVPVDITKVAKNVARGTIIARHSGDVSVVSWKDSKLVTIISTYHNADTYVGSKTGRALRKPVSVWDYNNTMRGVDLKDQKLSMYLIERKRAHKWYVKLFKRLLNVSIHNAFVLHRASLQRRGKLLLTHREFRYALARAIVEEHCPALQSNQPVGRDSRLRNDIVHVPSYKPGRSSRRRCVVHYKLGVQKSVKSVCKTCGVYLCFEDCWVKWHSQTNLPAREVLGRKRKHTE